MTNVYGIGVVEKYRILALQVQRGLMSVQELRQAMGFVEPETDMPSNWLDLIVDEYETT